MGELVKAAQVGEGLAIATKRGSVMQVDELAQAVRTLEKFGYQPSGGANGLGARFESILNQKFTDEVLTNLIGKMLPGVTSVAEAKDPMERALNTFLNSQMALGLGQSLGNSLTNILANPRVKAMQDIYLKQRNPDYVPPDEPTPNDINRELINRYDNPEGQPPFREREIIPFSGGMQQTEDEWIASLNPDDPVCQHEFMARKGIQGVPLDEVKRIMLREQKRVRGEKPVGIGSTSGDSWGEEDVGKGKPQSTMSESLRTSETTGSSSSMPPGFDKLPEGDKAFALWLKTQFDTLNHRMDSVETFVKDEIDEFVGKKTVANVKAAVKMDIPQELQHLLNSKSPLPEVNGTEEPLLAETPQEVTLSDGLQISPSDSSVIPVESSSGNKYADKVVEEVERKPFVKKVFSIKTEKRGDDIG